MPVNCYSSLQHHSDTQFLNNRKVETLLKGQSHKKTVSSMIMD